MRKVLDDLAELGFILAAKREKMQIGDHGFIARMHRRNLSFRVHETDVLGVERKIKNVTRLDRGLRLKLNLQPFCRQGIQLALIAPLIGTGEMNGAQNIFDRF